MDKNIKMVHSPEFKVNVVLELLKQNHCRYNQINKHAEIV